MIRGIERRLLFLDDADRWDFVCRLDRILPESGMACFGWALMPNHVHLVLRTGERRLSHVMARLNTGYALSFNRRHDRVGYLLQGRFKSIPVGDDSYWLTVVRYVHLNPVTAGIVGSLADLEAYPWTGHATLMGRGSVRFQTAAEFLRVFASEPEQARSRLRSWMEDGVERGEARAKLTGGAGALEDLIYEACGRAGLPVAQLPDGSSAARRVRNEIARVATQELGLSGVLVARRLGVSPATVSRASSRPSEPRR